MRHDNSLSASAGSDFAVRAGCSSLPTKLRLLSRPSSHERFDRAFRDGIFRTSAAVIEMMEGDQKVGSNWRWVLVVVVLDWLPLGSK